MQNESKPANLVYTYDLAGRRTSVSGSLASTQLPAAVSSATYNADNQLTQWGATQMTYDANGNTLSDGMNTYVWDARNHLVSANNNAATFAYDALDRRVDRNILSANTNFLYDGVNPVQELNGSTVTANLLTGGGDEYFTRTDASGTSNFLTDALGSTVELTDTSGNSQVQYSYGPFGSISITGTTTNTYTYTGRETDGLGLYYYRARYYNPMIGRFISEDPTGFAAGEIDLYGYAGDNPLNFIDTFGLDKNPPPLAPNKQPQPQQQPQKHQCSDLERLSKAWHGVETVGTLGVGVGTMLTGGLGLGAACLSGNPLVCFAAAEAAPAFIVGGYYVTRSAWNELQEPNNPYFGGDCQ